MHACPTPQPLLPLPLLPLLPSQLEGVFFVFAWLLAHKAFKELGKCKGLMGGARRACYGELPCALRSALAGVANNLLFAKATLDMDRVVRFRRSEEEAAVSEGWLEAGGAWRHMPASWRVPMQQQEAS